MIEDSEVASGSTKCVKCNNIDEIFAHYTTISEFCIGGKLELNANMSQFFYKTSNGATQCIDFLNISKEELHTLINNCSASPFGLGSQSVVDPNIRQAKELREKDFAFQFNPQMKSSITSQLKKLLGDREFLVQPYKLNIYPEGGHFKRHKDTIKNERMIASLVICLPIPFEGGILTVENEKGQSVSFDWGKETRNTIQWACFFCSCDHFISKVTKGNRLTIAYDVFRDESQEDSASNEKDTVPEKFRTLCSEKLGNYVKGLNLEKTYGYFPNHVYLFGDTEEETDFLRAKLKGNDLILYDVFKQNGWVVTLQVYYPDIESYGPVVNFCTGSGAESPIDMEYAIEETDKETLNKIATLELLNSEYKCKKEEIHDYEISYGYTGNSPVRQWESFYAGTIMVIHHQTVS